MGPKPFDFFLFPSLAENMSLSLTDGPAYLVVDLDGRAPPLRQREGLTGLGTRVAFGRFEVDGGALTQVAQIVVGSADPERKVLVLVAYVLRGTSGWLPADAVREFVSDYPTQRTPRFWEISQEEYDAIADALTSPGSTLIWANDDTLVRMADAWLRYLRHVQSESPASRTFSEAAALASEAIPLPWKASGTPAKLFSDELVLCDEADPWVWALQLYYPKNRFGETPAARRIWHFKDGIGVSGFADEIVNAVERLSLKRCVDLVASVPPHCHQVGHPSMVLARQVANRTGLIDGSELLHRDTPVSPAHLGGNRSVEIHLESIKVNPFIPIVGKGILLLDDLYTSGASMNACREILRRAGAGSVVGLCLGRTV